MSILTQPPKWLAHATACASLALLASGCASREERIQSIQVEANEALFLDDSAAAIETLRQGLRKYPDSNALRVALSNAEKNAGNLEEATHLLEQALEQDPENDQLWVKVGEYRAALGQSEAAIQAFEAYLKNHGDDFLAWKALALENEKLGKLTDAIKAASKWNDLTPSSQPALKLGELYLASRNLPQARSWFSQAAAYRDAYAAKDAVAELVALETSLKQYQQAATWLQRYRQRYGDDLSDPRLQESKSVLDSWARAREEIAQAAAELERERREVAEGTLDADRSAANERSRELETALSRQRPESVVLQDPAGEPSPTNGEERPPAPLFSESETQEATEEPETGDAPSSDSSPRYEEAMAALESGDTNAAIPLFWELLGEDSNDAQLWYQLSKAYYEQGNWFDAEATILEAKRRAPRSEAIANQYLLTLVNTQGEAQALEEGLALRRLFPRSAPIALTQANTLRASGASRARVAAAYREFLALANRNTPGYHEANQYLQSGN